MPRLSRALGVGCMPILLGLESAALAAAAYKWGVPLPKTRERAKEWYGYAKNYFLSENEAKIAVRPAAVQEEATRTHRRALPVDDHLVPFNRIKQAVLRIAWPKNELDDTIGTHDALRRI